MLAPFLPKKYVRGCSLQCASGDCRRNTKKDIHPMSPNIHEVRKCTSSWIDVLLNMHLQTHRKAHFHRCLAGISMPNGIINYRRLSRFDIVSSYMASRIFSGVWQRIRSYHEYCLHFVSEVTMGCAATHANPCGRAILLK
jgi:hypothetical protein